MIDLATLFFFSTLFTLSSSFKSQIFTFFSRNLFPSYVQSMSKLWISAKMNLVSRMTPSRHATAAARHRASLLVRVRDECQEVRGGGAAAEKCRLHSLAQSVGRRSLSQSPLSLSTGHGLDRSDPSTHVDRSEILTRP